MFENVEPAFNTAGHVSSFDRPKGRCPLTPVDLMKRTSLSAFVALLCTLPAGAAAIGGPRVLLSNAPRFLSVPAPTKSVDFAVHLPLRDEAAAEELVKVQSDPRSPMYQHWLTPAQFRSNFGPSPRSIASVSATLRAEGFSVTKVETQLIHVRGTVASAERAFNVHLGNIRDRDGVTRLAAREQLSIPSALAASNAVVLGLGYSIPPRPMSRVVPLNRYGGSGGYWFDDLKQAYDYPSYQKYNGAGMTIATVGYSDFSSSDAALYFQHEKLGTKGGLGPLPNIQHLVFPDSESFDPNNGASDEANLDVQQSAGSAPGATVVGIAAPATAGEGFLFAYSYIVDTNAFDIVSTSYGECELFYLPAYNFGTSYASILVSYHEMFVQGNIQGITFLFSSGDDSGRACPQANYLLDPGQGKAYRDVAGTSIWSDDPNVTSVGGTNLETVAPNPLPSPNPNPSATPVPATSSAYVSENAVADSIVSPIDPYGTGNFITNALWGSGGGTSAIFKAPSYQSKSNTGSSFRVSPDVAMQMGGCPYYGPSVVENCASTDSFVYAYIGGELGGLIGTSASAPEFAGLLAVKEQAYGGKRLGNANINIYELAENENAKGAFHQGFPVNNGVVTTRKAGFNPVVGNGTPDARNFIGLKNLPAAGNPQTSSNP
jgi:subtilase family serine protease